MARVYQPKEAKDNLTAALGLIARRLHVEVYDERTPDRVTQRIPWWETGRIITLFQSGQPFGETTLRVRAAPADWEPASVNGQAAGPGPAERGETDESLPVRKILAALRECSYHVKQPKNTARFGPVWRSGCPAHRSSTPGSTPLAVGEFPAGGAWVKCWGGCSTRDIMGALGLRAIDLIPEAERNHRAPEPGLTEDGEPDEHEAWQPGRTELGNARRLVTRYGTQIRYVPLWGAWLTWDGRRWRRDDVRRIQRFAKATVKGIYAEAARLDDPAKRKELADWAIRSESRSSVANMIALAESEPGIPIVPTELDANAWLLNVRNGTVDLRSGQLLPHDRGHLITRMAPVEFDPDAEAPLWRAFLDRIMAGCGEMIDYLQRLAGMALVGEVQQHLLPIFWGTGANGKTTFLEALLYACGDYGMAAAPGLLLESRHERHPTELADLFGKRLVVSQEANRGVRLDEARIKALTGGDRIKARLMHQDFFEFEPSHTPVLVTNHKPVVRGTDVGIWRRLRMVPFTVEIPEADRDAELGAKLRAEAAGILAWAVRGCLDWQRGGLAEPDQVSEATARYRSEMDTFGAFLAERCVLDKTAEARARDLYEAYRSWCEQEGERPFSQRTMGLVLAERGFQRRTNNGVVWLGIGLLTEGTEGFSGFSREARRTENNPEDPSDPSVRVRIRFRNGQWEVGKIGTTEVLETFRSREAAVGWASAGGKYEVVQ